MRDHIHTPKERKAIIKALEEILSTPKGQRVFSPTYGEQIKDLIFEEDECLVCALTWEENPGPCPKCGAGKYLQ